MKRATLAVAALAVLVVTAGAVAAAPGAAPDGIPVGTDDAQGEENSRADGHGGSEAHDAADDGRAGGHGDAGDDRPGENESDDADDGSEFDESDAPADESAGAADRRGPPADAGSRGGADERRPDAGDRGPPTDLPSQVPDFVTEIHRAIGDFLSGAVETNLGDVVGDLAPGDDGDGSADDGDAGGDAPDGANTTATTPTPSPEA